MAEGSEMKEWVCAGVVFDVDGTLLDSEPLYYAAYAHAAESFGVKYSFEIHKDIIGRPEFAGAEHLLKTLGLEGRVSVEEFLRARDELLDRTMPTVGPTKGALETVRHVKAGGKRKIAFATSADRKALEAKRVSNPELFGLADAVVCGDDEAVRGRGKPKPDIFLEAARLIDTPPAHCLAFEDAVAGVEAAAGAGMRVVAKPDPRLPREWFAKAECVVDTLIQTPFHKFGIPSIDGEEEEGEGEGEEGVGVE